MSAKVDRTGWLSMDAYDDAQDMILAGGNEYDIEIALIQRYPELNAQGIIPTILRRAYRDLAKLEA